MFQIIGSARHIGIVGTAVGLALLSATASAVPLFPGGLVALSGTTVGAQPYLAGTVVEDLLQPFSFTLPDGEVISGNVQDRVVQENGTGYLDFYFRIITDQDVQGDSMDVVRTNFAGGVLGVSGWPVDVDYRLDGLGISGPDEAKRSSNGADILFHFDGQTIGAGSSGSTRFTFIHTEYKKYVFAGKLGLWWDGNPEFVITAFKPVN